jgi:branched-chain amino acid transport system substrate-binding protein
MITLKRAAFAVAVSGILFQVGGAQATIGSCSDPILLGTTISETGPFSTLTTGWRGMTEAFEKEINRAGGVEVKACGKKLPIKFVIYDDQSNPSTAVRLFERLATVDNVDFFVGPDWTSIGVAVSSVAERQKIPAVMANVGAKAVFSRGLKYIWGNAHPSAPRWSEQYFDMLGKMSPKPKSMFFVTHDNPVTKELTELMSKRAEASGLKVVGDERFPGDLKNFSAIILKIKAAQPDVIYISSFDNPSVPLMQQMQQQGVKAMDVHHAMLSGSLKRQVGDGLEGVTGELAWYPTLGGDHAELWQTVLKASNVDLFDAIWSIGRLASYDVMVQAIERSGELDREKVREALFKGTFKAPSGDITYDETGFPNASAFTIQIQKGKVEFVWPRERATAPVVWPSPSWR